MDIALGATERCAKPGCSTSLGFNVATENGYRNCEFTHEKMVMFSSYVSLPEGIWLDSPLFSQTLDSGLINQQQSGFELETMGESREAGGNLKLGIEVNG